PNGAGGGHENLTDDVWRNSAGGLGSGCGTGGACCQRDGRPASETAKGRRATASPGRLVRKRHCRASETARRRGFANCDAGKGTKSPLRQLAGWNYELRITVIVQCAEIATSQAGKAIKCTVTVIPAAQGAFAPPR